MPFQTFYDCVSGGTTLSEGALNNEFIQIRLFYPKALELSQITQRFLSRILAQTTQNYEKNNKGITVYGRIRPQDFDFLHNSYSTFKYNDGTKDLLLQRFILYFPGNHYIHTYVYTSKTFNINTEQFTKHFNVEPLHINECTIPMIQDRVYRHSCIILFNKENDLTELKYKVDKFKEQKHNTRVFMSIYKPKPIRNAEDRAARASRANRPADPTQLISTSTKSTNPSQSASPAASTTSRTTTTTTTQPTSNSQTSPKAQPNDNFISLTTTSSSAKNNLSPQNKKPFTTSPPPPYTRNNHSISPPKKIVTGKTTSPF